MTIAAVLKILKEVTQWSPVIAEAGKKIYENTREMFGDNILPKKPSLTVTVQELDRKVAQLEQNDLDQTKLLAEMAQQTDNLSKLTSVLVTRTKYAHITAAISLIIAVYLLMRAWL